MDTNLVNVTEAVIKALAESPRLDGLVDSSDREATFGAEGDTDTATFSMAKDVDRAGTKPRHAPEAPPLGRITYVVTVKATYEPFEDD